MLTRLRLPAEILCDIQHVWLVSYLLLLSTQFVSKHFSFPKNIVEQNNLDINVALHVIFIVVYDIINWFMRSKPVIFNPSARCKIDEKGLSLKDLTNQGSLLKLLLSINEQYTSHKVYMSNVILTGNLILVSIILLGLAVFFVLKGTGHYWWLLKIIVSIKNYLVMSNCEKDFLWRNKVFKKEVISH